MHLRYMIMNFMLHVYIENITEPIETKYLDVVSYYKLIQNILIPA